MSDVRPRRLVVIAGTGTEVGKTWATARLAERWVTDGLTVAARKPAQSYEPDQDDDSTDAGQLAAATGEHPHEVCPPHRWYATAMAPPMAADSLRRDPILLADLVTEVERSWPTAPVDVGIVELAGGCWSPHAHDGDGLDLARALRPDAVLLVADAGLGTINSARPALQALGSVGPTILFLNRYDADLELHQRNAEWLRDSNGGAVVTSVDRSLADALRGGFAGTDR